MSMLLQDIDRMTVLRAHAPFQLSMADHWLHFKTGDTFTFVKSEIIPIPKRSVGKHYRLTAIMSDGRVISWHDFPWTELPVKPVCNATG